MDRWTRGPCIQWPASVEGGNVPHHVKIEGELYGEENFRGDMSRGTMSGSQSDDVDADTCVLTHTHIRRMRSFIDLCDKITTRRATRYDSLFSTLKIIKSRDSWTLRTFVIARDELRWSYRRRRRGRRFFISRLTCFHTVRIFSISVWSVSDCSWAVNFATLSRGSASLVSSYIYSQLAIYIYFGPMSLHMTVHD